MTPTIFDSKLLREASRLMEHALAILDQEHHAAAARLDHAIVELGLRSLGEGMPPFATSDNSSA